jgi:hypothetical protein
MPLALTTNGTVACGHGGSASLSGSGKLTVGGAKVLRQADIGAWAIGGCQQTNSDKGQVPCVSLLSVSGGTSAKLSVGQSPVLLATMTALSKEGKPANDVAAKSAGQQKLTA